MNSHFSGLDAGVVTAILGLIYLCYRFGPRGPFGMVVRGSRCSG